MRSAEAPGLRSLSRISRPPSPRNHRAGDLARQSPWAPGCAEQRPAGSRPEEPRARPGRRQEGVRDCREHLWAPGAGTLGVPSVLGTGGNGTRLKHRPGLQRARGGAREQGDGVTSTRRESSWSLVPSSQARGNQLATQWDFVRTAGGAAGAGLRRARTPVIKWCLSSFLFQWLGHHWLVQIQCRGASKN